jgi:hypothetical protein
MKLLSVLALVGLSQVAAGPAGDCDSQAGCFTFTKNPVADSCGKSGCVYEVCMKIDTNKAGCTKGGDTISHICDYGSGSNNCPVSGGGTKTGNVRTANMCVRGTVGETLYFSVKDGNGGGSDKSYNFNGDQATCTTMSSDTSKNCGGQSNQWSKEKLWKYTIVDDSSCGGDDCEGVCARRRRAKWSGNNEWDEEMFWEHPENRHLAECPDCDGGTGGGSGDPHLKTWAYKNYDYHGGCDMVLTKNDDYADGKGLNVQIRTKVESFYSYIEKVAVKIGEDILEVDRKDEGRFWVNGEETKELPLYISGYKFDKTGTVTNTKGETLGSSYILDLEGDAFIGFRVMWALMSVQLHGDDGMIGSSGLMGTYPEGIVQDREGNPIGYEAVGEHWQVREDEDPILFHELDGPQYPQKCEMPTESARHLRQSPEKIARAQEVCGHHHEEDIDACIMDVLVFGDENMAHAFMGL